MTSYAPGYQPGYQQPPYGQPAQSAQSSLSALGAGLGGIPQSSVGGDYRGQRPTGMPAQRQNLPQMYQSLFGRAPTQAGMDYWAGSGIPEDQMRQALINGASPTDRAYYDSHNGDRSGVQYGGNAVQPYGQQGANAARLGGIPAVHPSGFGSAQEAMQANPYYGMGNREIMQGMVPQDMYRSVDQFQPTAFRTAEELMNKDAMQSWKTNLNAGLPNGGRGGGRRNNPFFQQQQMANQMQQSVRQDGRDWRQAAKVPRPI